MVLNTPYKHTAFKIVEKVALLENTFLGYIWSFCFPPATNSAFEQSLDKGKGLGTRLALRVTGALEERGTLEGGEGGSDNCLRLVCKTQFLEEYEPSHYLPQKHEHTPPSSTAGDMVEGNRIHGLLWNLEIWDHISI